ncbi:helix-turn-helix domain-containing protein [Microbacterium sp. A93]|uniref:helix-turn-helix domain-containing protein n=1 Tax=Microbacterium sp. A93 TaxID=3450716 RepID=UPI003F440942
MTAEITHTFSTSLNRQVGLEVKTWLVRAGAKQVDLAAALQLSQTAVSKRLSGRTPFGIDELFVVADFLDIPLSRLLGNELLNERSPRPAMRDEGLRDRAPIAALDTGKSTSEKLPRLDSNQQPFD